LKKQLSLKYSIRSSRVLRQLSNPKNCTKQRQVFSADEVCENINDDLGFSIADRIIHAKRMGWLCDKVVETGNTTIADFICPTEDTRSAFGVSWRIGELEKPQQNLRLNC